MKKQPFGIEIETTAALIPCTEVVRAIHEAGYCWEMLARHHYDQSC